MKKKKKRILQARQENQKKVTPNETRKCSTSSGSMRNRVESTPCDPLATASDARNRRIQASDCELDTLGVPLKWHCFTCELVRLYRMGRLWVHRCAQRVQHPKDPDGRVYESVWVRVYVCGKEAKIQPTLRRIISVYMTQFPFSSFSPHSMRLINFAFVPSRLGRPEQHTHIAHMNRCVLGHRSLWKYPSPT